MDVRAALSARAGRLGQQGAGLAVFHGGEMSEAVAKELRKAGTEHGFAVTLLSLDTLSDWVSKQMLGAGGGRAVAVFCATTVEDAEPDEATTHCLQYLRRRTGADDTGPSLAGLRYAVLGLGDSNLLATSHRSVAWATAKDCNQAAQELDAWLEQQGGARFYARGEADERTGSATIEPWIAGIWPALKTAIVR